MVTQKKYYCTFWERERFLGVSTCAYSDASRRPLLILFRIEHRGCTAFAGDTISITGTFTTRFIAIHHYCGFFHLTS